MTCSGCADSVLINCDRRREPVKKRFSIKIGLVYAAAILGGMTLAGVFSIPGLFQNSDPATLLGNAENRDQILFEAMPAHNVCLLPAMFVNHLLDRRYFPSENYYINEDDQILQGSMGTIDPSTHADHLAMLRDACEAQNKDFFYVLCPGKPVDDEELRQHGIDCYRNENSDNLLAALDERHVPYLDLRPVLKDLSDGDLYQWFYKSDHHWTADAGAEAARRIVSELNARYHCGLDEQAAQEGNMKRTVFPEPWVGEMGQKILGPWSPQDHLVVWEPKQPVSFHLAETVSGKELDGGFDVFFHGEVLGHHLPWDRKSVYYYYMGGNDTLVKIDNRNLETGNLLIVKDSFSNVVVPYLSLSCAHVTIWDMREDQEILPYLQEHPEIETVIVMYNTSFSVKSDMNDFR